MEYKTPSTLNNAAGSRSVSVLTILAAIFFSGCISLWILDVHFLRKAGNPSESIPPAVAVGTVLILALLSGVLAWLIPAYRPDRKGMFFLYVALFVASTVAGVGFMQRFIILLTVYPYRATESEELASLVQYIPSWWMPADSQLITDLYEGRAGGVPWEAWGPAILFWTVLMGLLFFWMMCMMSMLRQPWVERERLVFPLADLAVRFAGDEEREPHYRRSIFWLGFILAALFHLFFILNYYFTLVPGASKSIGFSPVADRPWNALAWTPGIGINICFTVIGLAFLVNQEINFSIWITFVLIKLFQLFHSAAGYTASPFPNANTVVGGYAAVALICLWLARSHLMQVARRALGKPSRADDSNEAMSHRTAFFGFWIVPVLLAVMLMMSGISLQFTLIVLLLLFFLVITLARIRAESGAPIAWMAPWAGISWSSYFIGMIGSKHFTHGDFVLGTMLGIFTVGYFPLLGAAQIESLRMADDIGLRRRSMAKALYIGCFVGLIVSFAFSLHLFYKFGANTIADFEIPVYWGVYWPLKTFFTDTGSHWDGVPQIIGGGIVTAALFALRYVFLGFPIHPVGFLIAQTYGGNWMMGNVFIAWLFKALILKYGGVKIFRRMVPLFTGLAVGEMAIIGIWFILVRFIPGVPYALSWG